MHERGDEAARPGRTRKRGLGNEVGAWVRLGIRVVDSDDSDDVRLGYQSRPGALSSATRRRTEPRTTMEEVTTIKSNMAQPSER